VIYTLIMCRTYLILFGIGILHLCAGPSWALQQSSSLTKEKLLSFYKDFDELAMIASDEDVNKFRYAVRSDGSYSYLHFNKARFSAIYTTHRDLAEWELYPTHLNYYDGNLQLLSSAGGDPSGMIEEITLDQQIDVGYPIQVKACMWPLVEKLVQLGDFVPNDTGGAELVLEDRNTSISFDSYGRILKVVWWQDDSKSPNYLLWEYDGYSESDLLELPSSMKQTTIVAGQDGVAVPQHAHLDLKFITNPVDISRLIEFTDDNSNYRTKDWSSGDVYEVDGTFLYNEKEMADEYLAAINNSGPKQTRYFLLAGIGLLAIGSVWMLKSKKNAA
jgi:hypothetical protein